MNHRPGPAGISALSSTPSTMHLRPIFWMLPSAFSSIVVKPPSMLPLVGCEMLAAGELGGLAEDQGHAVGIELVERVAHRRVGAAAGGGVGLAALRRH